VSTRAALVGFAVLLAALAVVAQTPLMAIDHGRWAKASDLVWLDMAITVLALIVLGVRITRGR
jgi:hypothetical protein